MFCVLNDQTWRILHVIKGDPGACENSVPFSYVKVKTLPLVCKCLLLLVKAHWKASIQCSTVSVHCRHVGETVLFHYVLKCVKWCIYWILIGFFVFHLEAGQSQKVFRFRWTCVRIPTWAGDLQRAGNLVKLLMFPVSHQSRNTVAEEELFSYHCVMLELLLKCWKCHSA